MPLSTSIRDNLLHIITINPEVVVLRRHPPCLLQVPASSSTTALSVNASNEQTNEQNTNLVLRNGFPPTAVPLRIVASRANRLLHHSVVAVVTPFGTFEIDSIGSINLATSLQISQIKSICSVPVISFCVLLLNCANHPPTHPSIGLSPLSDIGSIPIEIPCHLRYHYYYYYGWMDAGTLQSRMHTHLFTY